ncbi:MAG: hypothetical protein L0H25_02825 [Micrococcales bacterium]|nr:hypothetical protein [Micrococcales bacterium]
MSADWTWTCFDAEGTPVIGDPAPGTGFPTQSDAENYLAESWKQLLDAGVDSVTLREGDTIVYGPMSLRPIE